MSAPWLAGITKPWAPLAVGLPALIVPLCTDSFLLDLVCAAAIGVLVFFYARSLLSSPDVQRKLQRWADHVGTKEQPEERPAPVSHRLSSTFGGRPASYIQNVSPWSGIRLERSLNEALEKFATCLIEDYINRWYKAEISADNTFLLETKYQIRFGGATAVRALHDFDFVRLIQTDLIPLALMHVDRVSKFLDSLAPPTDDAERRVSEKQVKRVFAADLHVALHSEENQEEYLRQIADLLVGRLMDDSRIGGREMDAEAPLTFSMPTLDFITSPDTINRLLITALEPKEKSERVKEKEPEVPFLENFGKFCRDDAPDSLLTLKLSDLARDSRLLQSFNKLEDAKGAEFNEVYSDAWQLFSAFVHESARTRIELFSEELIQLYTRSMEQRSLSGLIKATEGVYMELYQELNYSYVVPFCQSESYLGYLCGTSSEAEDLFQAEEPKEAASNLPPPSSSLSQFRSRIWGMLRGDFDASESPDERAENAPELDDEAKPLDAIDGSFLELEETVDHSIDMNTWTITIPKIEPRRSYRTHKIYFVYVVHVVRKADDPAESAACCSLGGLPNGALKRRMGSLCTPDGEEGLVETTVHPLSIRDDEDESDSEDEEEDPLEEQLEVFEALSELPRSWSMARTYDEFYVFDTRLRQFHGAQSQRFALLPDRKMACPRNRQFLESQRKYMESFLQQLAKQATLKQSELLFAFLTQAGDAGLETSFVDYDELSLRKAERRRSAEAEQNAYLTPFIARLLAKTLATEEPAGGNPADDPTNKADARSIDSGTFSSQHDGVSDIFDEFQLFDRVQPSNPHLSEASALVEHVEQPKDEEKRAVDTFERMKSHCIQPPAWLEQSAVVLADFFHRTLDRLFGRSLGVATDLLFDEETLLFIVRALHSVVFEEHREDATPDQVRERAVQAERLLNRWLRPAIVGQLSEEATERLRLGIRRVFRSFQHVHFNRQLAFVLLDVLVEHILPPDAESLLFQQLNERH
ncbi:Sorting nexin-14 [Aphelenchoides fujianensis]|nr:Sorting nexin-14 [Aphelenchoides fujianensis]